MPAPGGGLTNRGFVGRDGSAELMDYPDFAVQRAFDINDDDWIVGSWLPGAGLPERAYVAKAFGDEIRDLGLFPGVGGAIARAINNAGEIVGAASQGTDVRALYWPAGATQPTDLNTLVDLPGVTLLSAMDINNAGQILARGFGGYYILTPIPEPAVGVWVIGYWLLVTRRRRSVLGGRPSPAANAQEPVTSNE